MAKRKATNIQNMMAVRLESPEAIVEAMGTNDPDLAQQLINQVYKTYDAGRVFGVSYTALGRARIFCKTTRGKAPFPVFSLSPVLIKPHYNRSGGIGGPGGGRRGQPETRPKQG